MNFKVNVGISNRHVHLTKEIYEQLFDKEIVRLKDLKQKGEFASDSFVTIKGPKGEISKVRVLGPFRNYNQVEVSKSDAFLLGIDPPVRKSGDLNNSSDITIISDKGKVSLKSSCILAECHIHMNYEDLEKYNLVDNQLLEVVVDNDRKGILYARVKASSSGVLELHIDRDEANAFLLNNEEELTVKNEF